MGLLAGDVGARNVLMRVGDVVVKWRVDPDASVEREVEGLRACAGEAGLRCLGAVHRGELLEDAAKERDWEALQALDSPVGWGVLPGVACVGAGAVPRHLAFLLTLPLQVWTLQPSICRPWSHGRPFPSYPR